MSEGSGRYRWAHRALIAVSAALLAGCGPAAGSVASDAVPRSAIATPAPPSVADPSVADPSVADRSASGTTAAPSLPGVLNGALRGLAVAGGRVVAVGADDKGPAAWTVDGGAWSADTVAARTGTPRLDTVAQDGSVGVAFGAADAGASQGWVTDDLRTWRPHDTPGIDGRVGGATVADGRWIVVGDRVDPEGGEAYEGVVWVSEDAASFDVLAEGLPLAEGTLSDVAVANGTVVVVGFGIDGGVVWTSADDGPFEPGSGPFEAATIAGVAATDTGFVALGRGLADLGLRAWTSTDGSRWERATVSSDDLQPSDEIHDLATVDGIVVAVGGTDAAGVVWRFEDGTLSQVGS